MSEKRIIGERKEISYDSVQKFFDDRVNEKKNHLYNYVLYLDDKPEVAIERDKKGKEQLDKLITITPQMRILDIGCGVGRYGSYFLEKGAYYVGIDGSSKMIEMANENLKKYDRKKLIVSDLLQLSQVLDVENENEPFDVIFDCGVFMYLNDDDCVDLMKKIAKVGGAQSKVCIIESMAQESRLTLNDFYSEDLKQEYSAIYRSEKEYKEAMQTAFADNYELFFDEILDFEDGLQKKREYVTREHCVIWKHI